MILEKHLNEFYKQNNIPKDGGYGDAFFKFSVFGLDLNLPNPKFRRDAIHVHDLQHVLNNCDTSWKGESFISGWEIATGMWKYFPLGLLSLWALGYGFWLYPKQAYLGYKKGLTNHGIIDLQISKSAFLKMEFQELVERTHKTNVQNLRFTHYINFMFWLILSQLLLLFPILLVAALIIFFA